MIANGLAPKRAELLEGVIVEKISKSILHTRLLSRMVDALRQSLSEAYWLRQEAPITMRDSEPEPDISIVAGSEHAYLEHRTTALLVVEIAVSTVAEDRAMAALYASADVNEYWILNTAAREVEVFRKPQGGVYFEKEVLAADQMLTCQALPQLTLNLEYLWMGLTGV